MRNSLLVNRTLSGLSEALVGVEVLEVVEVRQRGKRIPRRFHPGDNLRLAKCRVVDHLYGHVGVDEHFYVLLRPTHALVTVGEEASPVDRYLSNLVGEHTVGTWASEETAEMLRTFVKDTPVFELPVEQLHFVDGILQGNPYGALAASGSDVTDPPGYAAVLASTRKVLDARLPLITFALGTEGISRWNAVIAPEGSVALWISPGSGDEEWTLPSADYERVQAAIAKLPQPPQRLDVGSSRRPGSPFVHVAVRTMQGVVTINVYGDASSSEPNSVTHALATIAGASRLLDRKLYGLDPFREFGKDR